METAPCPRCGVPLPPAVAVALRILCDDKRSRALGQPDLTGLAVCLVAELPRSPTPTEDAALFADAFRTWTGMSPTDFVAAVRHLWTDLGLGPMT